MNSESREMQFFPHPSSFIPHLFLASRHQRIIPFDAAQQFKI